MNIQKFWDFIVKNRYVILCVSIVLILLFTGVLKFLFNVVVVIVLLLIAVYIGKRIQDDQAYIRKLLNKRKSSVKYTVKDDEEGDNK